MRFDDSLSTVLASEAAPGFGAAATWRQLVDLIGRGRVPADGDAIERLRRLRGDVAQPVRAASARSLAFAHPPAPLVALFAEDELAVAAPVLRTATLSGGDWTALLPRLTAAGRSVLRHRRDLPAEAMRGLASFGSVDFVLGHAGFETAETGASRAPEAEPQREPAARMPAAEPSLPIDPPVEASAEAPPEALPAGGYAIADLVARIDAFQRRREDQPEAPPVAADSFRFETDATGTIEWVDGAPRATLVGVTLAHSEPQGLAQLDAVAAGAFRRRARFGGARLSVEGDSVVAGAWRIGAVPTFDEASGRFTGYRGVARRPRVDESAAPLVAPTASSEADSLRQLVHELRTPANAIVGFAELIETQLLGPVATVYRERAAAIRRHTTALMGAIDDLDTTTRIESRALDLRPSTVAVAPLVARLVGDLAPLARLRGAVVAFDPAGEPLVRADDRAVERLVGRLIAALLSVCRPGERLRLRLKTKGSGVVVLHLDRPQALTAMTDEALFGLDADTASDDDGAPLLGTGFALRLVRNLAAELGGSLVVGADRLTLRLPAALDREVQAAR